MAGIDRNGVRDLRLSVGGTDAREQAQRAPHVAFRAFRNSSEPLVGLRGP